MAHFPRFKYGVFLLGAITFLGSCAAASGPADRQDSVDRVADDVQVQDELVQEDIAAEGAIALNPDSNPDKLNPVTKAPSVASQPVSTDSGQVLFSCHTAEDKLIALYDRDTVIKYVFGPEEQPELVLDVPREEASTFQWQGIGRYENYSISIPNKDTVYIVSWARDRLDINQPAEAGVSVEIDGEYITTVDCVSDIIHNMIGVDLSPTQL
ncbi:hypothetical protein SPB21_10120 [Leptothoe sp. ISB3NOV94-8A]|uniref:hypothetical protein n=1 Tax=Adonisia turfae TaxID=2950184 RepID=UPI0013D25B83|nr:hypothetical protein [Adonisia turfae]